MSPICTIVMLKRISNLSYGFSITKFRVSNLLKPQTYEASRSKFMINLIIGYHAKQTKARDKIRQAKTLKYQVNSGYVLGGG